MAELVALDPRDRRAPARRRAPHPRRPARRGATGRTFELIMGERRWRASQAAGLGRHPGDHQGHERRRPAARRAAGEPAPQPAQPARGGRGLPAAARRLRLLPRGARHADRPFATADLQHAAPAQAAAARAAPGGGGRAECRPRPRPARHGRRRGHGAHGAAHRRRGAVGAQRRGARRRSARATTPPRRAVRAPGAATRSSTTSRPASRTTSRPGSRSPWVSARARSRSSSPRWRTCAASWA